MTDMDAVAVRKLFAQSCDFLLAAAEPEQFPKSPLAEIAFIGRSNVGKSSLINALVGRKNVARTSNTPGRTQQVVFFNLGQKLILTDLPGYGFAKAPREEKSRWDALVNLYLRTRPKLRCVCLLVDGRHGALANDIEMMTLLDRAAANYRIILTKADKVHAREIELTKQQVEAVTQKHPAAYPTALVTSSDKGTGMEDLRMFMASFIDRA